MRLHNQVLFSDAGKVNVTFKSSNWLTLIRYNRVWMYHEDHFQSSNVVLLTLVEQNICCCHSQFSISLEIREQCQEDEILSTLGFEEDISFNSFAFLNLCPHLPKWQEFCWCQQNKVVTLEQQFGDFNGGREQDCEKRIEFSNLRKWIQVEKKTFGKNVSQISGTFYPRFM